MMKHGQAWVESFVLHSILAGLMIVLAGTIKPPPKTIHLDFSLLEKIVAPVRQESPIPEKAAISKPKTKPEPAPQPRPKIVPTPPAPTPPNKVKEIKPRLAAVKPKPVVQPKLTAVRPKSATVTTAAKPSTIPEVSPQAAVVSPPPQYLAQKEPANGKKAIPSAQQGMDLSQVNAKLQNYFSIVRLRIEKKKRYPLHARSRRLEGEVSVRFVLNPDGRVSAVDVSKSSGQDCLDRAAVEAIRQAAPMPRPPDGLLSSATSMELTIVFKLT